MSVLEANNLMYLTTLNGLTTQLWRHNDYRTVVDEIGMRLDFVWAPYDSNLTNLITTFKQNRNSLDVLIMGSGLWHMLRVTNESDCKVSLQRVNR
ncbi:hypothetical protein G4B88_014427 [Cannabis sativa]|uniref:Uncharacterized protein n=1 Tax=Cannabis sativa TaxID=3483 RepID=A0A7J6IA73_CANSA|nr:hypothetical protein G4B88_014427 [Cannabis sativa]